MTAQPGNQNASPLCTLHQLPYSHAPPLRPRAGLVPEATSQVSPPFSLHPAPQGSPKSLGLLRQEGLSLSSLCSEVLLGV